jgi:hypothetical protein
MISNGLVQKRTIPTGNGQRNKQSRFYCPVHGYFDLFVFPEAEAKHKKCDQLEKSQAEQSKA